MELPELPTHDGRNSEVWMMIQRWEQADEQQAISSAAFDVDGAIDAALRAYGLACAQAALEAAAKVCDSVDNHANPMTATDCADAIRAIQVQP